MPLHPFTEVPQAPPSLSELLPFDGSCPSWYLDPLVADQKRIITRQWILNHCGALTPAVVLKTDLFEEAYNHDHLLWDLFPEARLTLGIDIDPRTSARAAARRPCPHAHCLSADVLRLPFPSATFDAIVSTSTLDHFETPAELHAAIAELVRILRPGGRLFITLDNPRNPLYPPLRWLSRLKRAPFALGQTLSSSALARQLEFSGLRVIGQTALIHNPRVLSTLFFLALRRLLGRHADVPIRALLSLFALLQRLPTRNFTACFVAVAAVKPATTP